MVLTIQAIDVLLIKYQLTDKIPTTKFYFDFNYLFLVSELNMNMIGVFFFLVNNKMGVLISLFSLNGLSF